MVQLPLDYSNISEKRRIRRCGTYYKGGAYYREVLISRWIPKDLSLIRGEFNRLFVPIRGPAHIRENTLCKKYLR